MICLGQVKKYSISFLYAIFNCYFEVYYCSFINSVWKLKTNDQSLTSDKKVGCVSDFLSDAVVRHAPEQSRIFGRRVQNGQQHNSTMLLNKTGFRQFFSLFARKLFSFKVVGLIFGCTRCCNRSWEHIIVFSFPTNCLRSQRVCRNCTLEVGWITLSDHNSLSDGCDAEMTKTYLNIHSFEKKNKLVHFYWRSE